MRIWLKPDVMQQYGLVPSDIITVLGEQNIEASTGTLGEDSENTFQYTLKYRGRYETGEEFGEMVIRTTEGGNTLRLKDVADIELGTTSYNFSGGVSGYPGATFMVMQTAGSNANEIIEEINGVVDEIPGGPARRSGAGEHDEREVLPRRLHQERYQDAH